jgi:hypothetical protein
MFLKVQRDAARPDGFAAWRIVVWLMLLLAAFGCLQNGVHAQHLWDALRGHATLDDDATSQLHRMLAWDAGFFIVAFATVVICAGAILRQAWARPALQMIAVLLALGWGLLGGVTSLAQWHDFSNQIALTSAQQPLDATYQAAFDQVRRTFMVSLSLRVLAVPVLLWLAWYLSRPPVRAQFKLRPKRP